MIGRLAVEIAEDNLSLGFEYEWVSKGGPPW